MVHISTRPISSSMVKRTSKTLSQTTKLIPKASNQASPLEVRMLSSKARLPLGLHIYLRAFNRQCQTDHLRRTWEQTILHWLIQTNQTRFILRPLTSPISRNHLKVGSSEDSLTMRRRKIWERTILISATPIWQVELHLLINPPMPLPSWELTRLICITMR